MTHTLTERIIAEMSGQPVRYALCDAAEEFTVTTGSIDEIAEDWPTDSDWKMVAVIAGKMYPVKDSELQDLILARQRLDADD